MYFTGRWGLKLFCLIWGRMDFVCGEWYLYGWIPLLFTWKYHNIVNQLYTPIQNNKFKRKKKANKKWNIWISHEIFSNQVDGTVVKNLPAIQKTWVWFLGQEDTLEKEMATHASILAWRIPWTEESVRLQFIGNTVRHDWSYLATCMQHFLFKI